VSATVAAAYVQDQLMLDPHWSVIAGLRYDRFKVEFDDRRTLVPAVDLARTDSEVSPRAGIVWSPTSGSSYYASYSYAFLPSGEQLSLAATTQDLAPETSVNYELGARWDIRTRLTLSAAVFRTLRQDVRVADPFTPGQFVRTGEQRAQGAEIGLQGEVASWWQLFGGYSRLDARVTSPVSTGTNPTPGSVIPAGNRLPLTPKNTFAVWNRFDLTGGWGAGLGVTWQDEAFTSISNTVRIPAFTRVDAALYYAFAGGRSRIALNVDNVADRKYYPTVDGDNNISPGVPRNARLTYTQSF